LGYNRKKYTDDAVPVIKSLKLKSATIRKPPLRRSPRKHPSSEILSSFEPEPNEPVAEPFELSQIEQLRDEVEKLRLEKKSFLEKISTLEIQIQNRTYSYHTIKYNKLFFKNQTGLELESFDSLYKFLNPGNNCENMKMYDSSLKPKNTKDDDIILFCSPNQQKNRRTSKQGPRTKLDSKDQLFLFLTWLKCGSSLEHSSWLFQLPTSTISRYIITWSNFMYFSLGAIPIWPSKDSVIKTMPKCFKETYPSTRCIIDCTELYCQRPSGLHSQSCMYSKYKSHVT